MCTVQLISAQDQPGRKRMYQYIIEAKSLMSNIYPVPITRIVVKVLRKIPKPEYRSHIHK